MEARLQSLASGETPMPRYRVEDFQDKDLQECDLVMQGGVASGVVYPPAVLRIATEYRIRSVGGTSAGALAAAATAAAEYGRDKGGYMELQSLTDELRKDSFVLNLFQPSSPMRPLFNTLLAFMQKNDPANTTKQMPNRSEQSHAKHPFLAVASKAKNVLWLTEVLLQHNLVAFMSGAVGGVALPMICSQLVGGSLNGAKVLLLLAFGWLGGVLGSVGYLAWILLHDVVDKDKHLFGMCTGSKDTLATSRKGDPRRVRRPRRKKDKYSCSSWINTIARRYNAERNAHPVLTDWLHTWINRLAQQTTEQPLTFGDLKQKQITFKLVTTNLSQGQPYMLPFKTDGFIFKRKDMQKLFPEPVVEYMIKAVEKQHPSYHQLPEGYCYMPSGDKMPIIVATRLSLSFPILLSAVRLYTVKPNAFERKRGDKVDEHDLQEHWFSDGGITSNFPIHMFDAWMPTRPTFGIKLTGMPDDYTMQGDENEACIDSQQAKHSVFLPPPSQQVPPDWIQVDGLIGFFANMFNTARNYRDNLQATLPSYRERIAQVRLEANEGGLNLNMSLDTICKMMAKGHLAGEALVKFGRNGFSQHQWVRMRVLMAQLEKEVAQMRHDFFKVVSASQDVSPLKQRTHYELLLGQYQDLMTQQVKLNSSDLHWYVHQDQLWCDQALQRIKAFLSVIEQWELCQAEWEKRNPDYDYKGKFFSHNGPSPEPVLRVTPGV